MSNQLPLLEVETRPPRLTEQQALVLARLETAAAAGLHADEVGAIAHSVMESRWRHGEGDRCLYCAGLVRYRAKLKTWQAIDAPEPEIEMRGMLRDDEELPF